MALTVLTVMPGLVHATVDAEAVEAAGGRQPLIITGGSGYAPFYYQNSAGQPDGIMVDIWQTWAQAAGEQVVFRIVPWERAGQAIQDGHADIIVGLNQTTERAKKYLFGPTFLSLETRIYHNSVIPLARNLDALSGFEIGVVKGDYATQLIQEKHPGANLVDYSSYETMVDRFAAGDIDVIVGDDKVIEYYLAREKVKQHSIRVLSEPLHRQMIAGVVAKNRPKLAQKLRAGFQNMDEDAVENIMATWQAEEVAQHYWQYMVAGIGVFLVLVTFTLAWNRLLRHKVNAATDELQKSSTEMARSEAEMRAILTSMGCLILEVDGRGLIRRVVRTGYRPDELNPKTLEGKYLREAAPLQAPQDVESVLADVIERNIPRQVALRAVLSGEQVHFTASCTPFGDTVLMVCHDQTALRRNEAKYRELVELAGCIILRLDSNGRIQFFNKYAQNVFGLSEESVRGQPVYGTLLPTDDGNGLFRFQSTDPLDPGRYLLTEVEHALPNGGAVYVQWAVKPILENGVYTGLQCIGHDVTLQRNARTEIARRERYYKSLIEQSSDMITVLDESGYVLFESPAVARCLELTPDEVAGDLLADTLHPEDVPAVQTLLAYVAAAQSGDTPRFEFRRRHKNGTWVDFEALATNRLDDEAVGGIIINSRDVTDRKHSEAELRRHTFYDSLTGLPNRSLLFDRLKLCLERSRRKPGYAFALLFVDLDRFKVINDSLGHAIGDKLLVETGERLGRCLRKTDTLARFGSDEFVLLLDEIENDRTPIRVAKRVREEVSRRLMIDGAEIFTSASVGIVYSSMEYQDPEQMVRDADIAMHRAKTSGDTHYTVFHSGMHAQAQAQLQLETDLRKALELDEFELHYQPIVDLATEKLVGLEALIRWNHPERGFVPPLDFISLAEETGLIVPIGEWVLRTACTEVNQEAFLSRGYDPVVVAVNLSPKQVLKPDLSERILGILQSTDFNPGHLKLEVTESTVMESPAQASATFETLQRFGLKLAIDDFGTGYSSLSCLHSLPFDTLKIDRKFTAGLLEGISSKKAGIVQTILSLASGLNLSVVAEGIETQEQLERLRALGCDMGQGFYFAKPMPAGQLWDFIAKPDAKARPDVWTPSQGALS